jgi:phage baseplate assembly protein V
VNGESGGVYIATVVSGKLDEQGRIGIEIPSKSSSYQAYFASAMAGKDRGLVFLPDKGDQVVVAFVNGQPGMPVVLGALWSNVAKPPIDNADGKNNVKLIRTRSGHQIRLTDEQGKEAIEVIDSTGKNKVVIDAANKKIEISCDGDVSVHGKKITLDGDVHVTGKAAFDKEVAIGTGPKTIIDRNEIKGQ